MKIIFTILVSCYLLQNTNCEQSPCTQAAKEGKSLEGCPVLPPQDVLPPALKGDCVSGTSWSPDGCNTCHCGENGVASCTQKGCRTGVANVTPWPLPVPILKSCVPGTSWIHVDGCNKCLCSKTGTPSCTQKLCLADSLIPDPLQDSPCYKFPWLIRQCGVPPSFSRVSEFLNPFYNYLFDGGFPVTSPPVIGFPEFIVPGVGITQPLGKSCVPGQSWFDGCNSCHCSNDGLPACTKKKCEETTILPKTPISPLSCEPGQSWFDGCNSCHCSKDGLPACTQKKCEETTILPKTPISPLNCLAGQSWFDGCNTCYCTNEGLPACTRKQCEGISHILLPRSLKAKECEPGTHWMDDCNQCFCSSGGVKACTYKYCLPKGP